MCSDGTYPPGGSRGDHRPRSAGFSLARLMAGAVAAVLLLLFTAISCTVKENRAHCPCLLAVRISAVRSPPATFVCISEQDAANINVPGDTLFHVPVPRGRVLALAYAGVEGIPHPEEGCTAPPGHAFPPLYLASASVEASGDSVAVHLPLRKQFCTLSLTLEGPPGWAEPYAMEVCGEVCGVSLDGAPLPGSFRAPLSAPFAVRLPRQHPEDPLWLNVRMPADSVLRRFNLGAVLQDAGYDWTAPDLEDLDLTLELSVTAVTFRSGLWSTTVPLDIII